MHSSFRTLALLVAPLLCACPESEETGDPQENQRETETSGDDVGGGGTSSSTETTTDPTGSSSSSTQATGEAGTTVVETGTTQGPDDDGSTGTTGEPATTAVVAYEPDGTAVAADFSCLGMRPRPPAGDLLEVEWPVFAFGERDEDGAPRTVTGAVVTVFEHPFTGDAPEEGTVATEGELGVQRVTVPERGWFSYRTEAEGFIPTVENRVEVVPGPSWFNTMRRETLAGFAGLVGRTPDPSLGLIAGRMLDCLGRPVGGARLTVRRPEDMSPVDVLVAYFTDQGLPSTTQTATASPGRFAIIDAPVGMLQVEFRGSLSEDGPPVLLGCERYETFADTLTTGRILPLRADAEASCPAE